MIRIPYAISILYDSSFDFAPWRSLVVSFRTAAALSGERVLVPLAVEARAWKITC